MKKFAIIPVLWLTSLALLLTFVTTIQPYNNSPPIRSDGSGYHIWVHAIKHGSISFCEHRSIVGPGAISMIDSTGEKCGNKYPPGVGIIQAPLTIPFAQRDTSEGYSTAEHWLVLIIGSILLLLTTFLSGKTLQNLGCNNKAIIFSTGATIFGTGLFHYATYDASFSHVYSAFLFSCVLNIASQLKDETIKTCDLKLFAYGILCTLLILTRQTNLILILSASLILAYNHNLSFSQKKIYAFFSVLCTSAGITFYLAYNYYHLETFSLSTYGQESVVPFAEHSLRVFASYERGLFTYYPIFLLAIAIGWITPKARLIYLISLLLMISYGLIYGSWSSWPLGAGFGHRGFVDMTPIIMLTLGLSFQTLITSKFKNFFIPLIVTISMVSIYVTVATQHAYWRSNYPFSGATESLYWNTLLQTPRNTD